MSDDFPHIGLPLEKPVRELNQILEIDFQKLFTSGLKAIAFGSMEDPRAVSNFVEACGAAEIVSSRPEIVEDPGKLAWLLIHDTLVRTVAELLKEHQREMQESYDALDEEKKPSTEEARIELSDAVNKALEDFSNHEVRITADFFRHPKDFAALDAFAGLFAEWLQMVGQTEQEAKNIADRLPSYFVFSLGEEWREHFSEYERIVEAVETPFTKAANREREWQQYRAHLQRQIDEPIFEESFSLRQIYVEPRAYFVKKQENGGDGEFDTDSNHEETITKGKRSDKKVVVSLMDEMVKWVEEGNKDKSLKVIRGGPGIGKSSFSKMFAAKIAEKKDIPVLFIPLHRFNPEGDLEDSVGRYVKDAGHFTYTPVDRDEGEDRILIIFDGLDELSMQGQVGAEAAKEFVQEVRNRVNVRNASSLTRSPENAPRGSAGMNLVDWSVSMTGQS